MGCGGAKLWARQRSLAGSRAAKALEGNKEQKQEAGLSWAPFLCSLVEGFAEVFLLGLTRRKIRHEV